MHDGEGSEEGIEPVYHDETLDLWGGVKLRVAQIERNLYFPVRTICLALGIAPQTQIDRLRNDSDFAPLMRSFEVETKRGSRDAVFLHYDGMGLWLASVQSSRVREDAREKVREFRAEVMRAASRILFHEEEPLKRMEAPRALPVAHDDVIRLVSALEHRIGRIESTVYVNAQASDESEEGIMYAPFTCEHGTTYTLKLKMYTPEIVEIVREDDSE